MSAGEEPELMEEVVGELLIDATGPAAMARDAEDFSDAYDAYSQDPGFWTGLQLGASSLSVVPLLGVLKPIAKRAGDVAEAGGEVAEGIVYRRLNYKTGETYVGQSKSAERFETRKKEHNRAHKVEHDYQVLGNANPGKDLDVLEEDMIRIHGGPQREGGPLANKRHQMTEKRYRGAGGKQP